MDESDRIARITEELVSLGGDAELVKAYVDFCIERSRDVGHKHHILPKAVFPEYANLRVHEWNAVTLSPADHYTAHAMLHRAVDNFSIASAWFSMHHRNKVDSPVIYQELIAKRDKLNSMNRSGKVLVKNVTTGESKLVSSAEFTANSNLVGVKKGLISVIDVETDKMVTISSEEFLSNRQKYRSSFADNIVVYCEKEQRAVSIPKSEFDKSIHKGIKAHTGERSVLCHICNREVSASNHQRHVDAHSRRMVWATSLDNFHSEKVSETDFVLNLSKTHYINENGSILYKEGQYFKRLKPKTGPLPKEECPYCGMMIGTKRNFKAHVSKHEEAQK